jgi:hypothetical protein
MYSNNKKCYKNNFKRKLLLLEIELKFNLGTTESINKNIAKLKYRRKILVKKRNVSHLFVPI